MTFNITIFLFLVDNYTIFFFVTFILMKLCMVTSVTHYTEDGDVESEWEEENNSIVY